VAALPGPRKRPNPPPGRHGATLPSRRKRALNCPASLVAHEIDRVRDGRRERVRDVVAAEEPLEIRLSLVVDGERQVRPLSVTMRTPGHDFDLAAGLLFAEGIVARPADIEEICFDPAVEDAAEHRNTVLVRLAPGVAVDFGRLQRTFAASSACGVCGKASLDALVHDGCRPVRRELHVSPATLLALPPAMTAAQSSFESTGGVHACALFSPFGELRCLCEDVGRHNALDKLVGTAFRAGSLAELETSVLLLSGRASYELLQKALRARVPVVASVGAPSSLAVEMAETFGITLVGFLRTNGFNIYAGGERIRDN